MSSWGAGQGFAKGFANQMAKNLEIKYKEEQDEARVAADRYKMDKDAFLKSEKEDEQKINQAEQLIDSLYPGADKRNKDARLIDALNMLRANISYDQVKKDFEGRVYQELQEEKKVERENNVVDVNNQTDELIKEATTALDTPSNEPVKTEEPVVEKDDRNLFERIGDKRAERRTSRMEGRVDALTGVSEDDRNRVSKPYAPSMYTGESGTIFTRVKDDEKIPQYQKITSVTATNVKSYISAANQANDPAYSKIYTDLAVLYEKGEDLPESMAEVSANYARLATNKQMAETDPTRGWTERQEEEYQIAEKTYNNMINISVQVERVKDIKPQVLRKIGEDGNVEFKDVVIKPGNNISGAQDTYIPADNSGVIALNTNEWEVVTDEENKRRDDIVKGFDSEITKYAGDLAANATGLEMVTQIVGLVDQSQGQVLTTMSGLAVVGERVVAEGVTFVNVVNGYFSEEGAVDDSKFTKAENGDLVLTQEAFEQDLMVQGVLRPGETLDDVVARIQGQGNLDLATQKQLFESKLLLAAFRMGRLEGQQGNAMSNRDFEKLMQIIRPTRSNVAAFKSQIGDYFRGRLNILNANADNFLNAGQVQSFIGEYGYSPFVNMENPVVYMEDYLTNSQNRGATDEMRAGYEFVMGNAPGIKIEEKVDEYVPGSIVIEGVPDTAITILKNGMNNYSDEELKTFFIGKYGEDKYNEVMGNK